MPDQAAPAARRISGPTIMLGDGAYFDFVTPDAAAMTIEDYAWGLLRPRFSGQTREAVGPNRVPGRRMLYFVAQHCVLLARQMAREGHSWPAIYQGLMHESDEVVWGDFPSPAKSLLPAELRALIKRSAHAIDARFEVGHNHHALVKRYDLRMLATEKRDLMPHANFDKWRAISGIEPFDFVIDPWPADEAARRFIEFYHQVRSVLDAR